MNFGMASWRHSTRPVSVRAGLGGEMAMKALLVPFVLMAALAAVAAGVTGPAFAEKHALSTR